VRTHSTTILAVRHNGQTAVGGDGQVTIENTIMKQGARKVRRLYQDRVVAGFAGAAGDALALFERFEAKLQESAGNLPRAAYQLVKEWRCSLSLTSTTFCSFQAPAISSSPTTTSSPSVPEAPTRSPPRAH
jgi:ATP-dependent protease HslVU peptidase subunit